MEIRVTEPDPPLEGISRSDRPKRTQIRIRLLGNIKLDSTQKLESATLVKHFYNQGGGRGLGSPKNYALDSNI